MSWSFRKELMTQVEDIIKKRISLFQRNMREELMSSAQQGVIESPVMPEPAPSKDLSSSEAVYGNVDLKQQLRFPRGMVQTGPSGNYGGMATFNRLTAPSRAGSLSQDVMIQQARKGMVTEDRKRNRVWEESLKKKQQLRSRLITRAKRRSGF